MPTRVNDESLDAKHESCSSVEELCKSIDALVDQLHPKAGKDPILGRISALERCRREEAVRQANASMFLEGFTVSEEAAELDRQFINGEIDLPTLLRANPHRKQPDEGG